MQPLTFQEQVDPDYHTQMASDLTSLKILIKYWNVKMKKSQKTNPMRLALVAMAVLTAAGCASKAPAPALPDTLELEPFKRVKTTFKHTWNKDEVFPFTGGAAIDIDNDGVMEVFVSGGHNKPDALLSYQDDELVGIDNAAGLSKLTASYGATAIDFNNDGQTDLIVSREDGVWLHTNSDGQFDSVKIAYNEGVGESAVAVAVADIDLDGDVDLYLSNFITYKEWVSATFNNPDHIRYNRLLRNDGDLKFTDITKESGTGGTQNTFLSVFTDLDQDGLQDLVLSNNTGRIEILHNEGDNTFTKNSYNSGLGYWMGVGVGDYDGDGDQDIAVSNVSTSIPNKLLRGDLKKGQKIDQEWVMLRNDGNRVFTDVAADTGLTRQGFGWGIVFEDLNLDGNLDVLAAQSYIKWPPHKLSPLSGRAMLQVVSDSGRKFFNAPGLNLPNRYFGQSAIIADLNGDAKQDVVWVNMDGPVVASLNQHTNDVVTLDVPETAKWLGARVTAITDSGKSYTREVNNAVGMQTDQSPHLSFAVPKNGSIEQIEVAFADGTTMMITPTGPGLVRTVSPEGPSLASL